MKIITTNLLTDGRVAYLSADKSWVDNIASAQLYDDEAGEAALKDAQARIGEITEAYLIDAGEAGAPAGRAALRETIRSAGPTNRDDLGKQAGNA